MFRRAYVASGVAALLIFFVRWGSDSTGPHTPARVRVVGMRDTLRIGDTLGLRAVAVNAKGDSVRQTAFTWTATDPAVASISGTGSLVAKGVGAVTVSAAVGGITGSASSTVTVVPISA